MDLQNKSFLSNQLSNYGTEGKAHEETASATAIAHQRTVFLRVKESAPCLAVEAYIFLRMYPRKHAIVQSLHPHGIELESLPGEAPK